MPALRHAALAAVIVVSTPSLGAAACGFDPAGLTFLGEPREQAVCLLRQVNRGARLGPVLRKLPKPFDEIVGKPFNLPEGGLEKYLAARGLDRKAVGGSIEGGLSRARNGRKDAPDARYFVIHDTSTPNCSVRKRCPVQGEFPKNMNDASWRYNKLSAWGRARAHVVVTRTGMSRTLRDFKRPLRVTKLEKAHFKTAPGLFLHIENVQPRVGQPRIPPKGQKANDLIAPSPGLTIPQYDRLSLLYIVASHRKGSWMIPVFHAVMDEGIVGGHDDPQNFDLTFWGSRLMTVMKDIRTAR